jgi:serine/threonine-protein kinase
LSYIDQQICDLIGAELFSRYRVESILGAGGMGIVFSAYDLTLSRNVAIKTVHPNLSKHADRIEFLIQEAKLLAQLSECHFFPNVYDLVISPQEMLPVIVLELLRGKTLWSVIRHNSNPPSSSWCIDVASQIARSLMYLHERGIVHQDIKPKNVFVLNESGGLDFIKLLDLGVSVTKRQIRNAGDDLSKILSGTQDYMAPEMVAEGMISESVDIYSFGVLLVEVLCSHYPYQASAHQKNLQKFISDPATIWADSRLAWMPDKLRLLLERMITRNPSDRPRSIECVQEFEWLNWNMC